VTGRQAAVAGVERTAGPTIATVPVRVLVDENVNVKDLLSQVQAQTTTMTEFEQTGLQRIRRISRDLDLASQFQTLVVIQPPQQSKKESLIFEHHMQNELDEGSDESAFALEIICHLEDNGLRININFDSAVLEIDWTAAGAHPKAGMCATK
jgi:non-ribosomal peptide synthetase component F